jgi:predicted double-glycine peptidase
VAAPAAAGDPQRGEPVRSLAEIRGEQVVRQGWDLSCGAAAVATLLSYQLQRPTSERAVAVAMLRRTDPALVRARQGFSLLDLKRFASAHGLFAAGFAELDLADLDRMAPLIVPITWHGFHHFVVYRGRRDGRVLLADPAFGNRTLTEATFRQAWAGRIGFRIIDPAQPQAPNRMGAPAELFLAPGAQVERAALFGG